MPLARHIAKVWLVCTLGFLVVFAAIAGGFALVQQQWRDRLTGDVHPVTVTVVGGHRSDDTCGRRFGPRGYDWEVTWTEDGRLRHGTWFNCSRTPPRGTEVDTLVTGHGQLGGDTTRNYYLWWPVVSAGLGSLLSLAWFTGRGRARYRAIRARGAAA